MAMLISPNWFILLVHLDLYLLLNCFYCLSYGFIYSYRVGCFTHKQVTKTGNIKNVYVEPPRANEELRNDSSGDLPQSHFFQIHTL